MKKILLTILFGTLLIPLLCLNSSAQDAAKTDEVAAQPANEVQAAQPAEAQPAQNPQEEDQLFGFGKVVQISATAMSLTEYDFETDKEQQIDYVLNDQTKLDNIANLSEIKVADEVGVNYEEKDGKKIAKTIFKYVDMEEEGTTDAGAADTTEATTPAPAAGEPAAAPVQEQTEPAPAAK
ncbi:MAG: hypothetical protein HQL24_00975 [Candidatus Omnitrophica bacterium]|nr:hypothetical protein [Candidatus Omnitrophota bacterium]